MKAKFTAAIILSSMLLTACNPEQSLIDDIETSGTTASAPPVQGVREGTQSDGNKGEINYVLGGGTETTVSAADTTEEAASYEILPPKIENISEDVELNIEAIDISGILSDDQNYGMIFFLGNVAAIGPHGGKGEICFFDTTDKTLKSKITPPDGWEFEWNYNCIKGSGDVLCAIKLSRYNPEKLGEDFAALVVHTDFSTEVIEDDPEKALAIHVGDHKISDVNYNIYDADSGEIIVEGFSDSENESGFAWEAKWFKYRFPIDENRFVYNTVGNEWNPSFGYYDFTAGKAADFPDSQNFQPIGYRNGKIYAKEKWWDGNCQGELYTFDVETLEKEHFMSSLAEFETDPDFFEYMEYSMPPDGEYIVAVHEKYDYKNLATAATTFYIISTDSGETLAKCEFNSIGINYDVEFINDNCFAAKNGDSEIIIFDVKM